MKNIPIVINIPEAKIEYESRQTGTNGVLSVWQDEYIREMARLQAKCDFEQELSLQKQAEEAADGARLNSFDAAGIVADIEGGDMDSAKLSELVVDALTQKTMTAPGVVDLIKEMVGEADGNRLVYETVIGTFGENAMTRDMKELFLVPLKRTCRGFYGAEGLDEYFRALDDAYLKIRRAKRMDEACAPLFFCSR